MVIEQLGYELTAIADNADDALRALRQESPDVILMDIQINDRLTGIELANLMKPLTPAPIIYVTAFKDKDVISKATSTAPAAYIIKPYEPESLQAAIELAVFKRPLQTLKPPSASHRSFYIKNSHRLIKVNVSEIMFVEVQEKYCYIATAQKRHVINMHLKDLLDSLPSEDFIQVHRSFVVRKSAIEDRSGNRTCGWSQIDCGASVERVSSKF